MVLTLLLSGAAELAAQEAVIGLKGGMDSYNLSWKPDSLSTDIDGETGFVGGLFGGITFTKVVGAQVELLYSQRRVKDVADDVELEGRYFEIPLLFTAKFPIEGTKLRPILFAGPSVSFESKCELSGEIEGIAISVDCDEPPADVDRKTTDWAVVFGVGADYAVGPLLIGAEWRYNYGLTNINDDPVTRDDETVKSRAWAVLLSVGYPIPL